MNKKDVNTDTNARCSQYYMVEAKIYEICGVKLFRKCVFALEKWIHRRDKGTNINYHIASIDEAATREFIKFLFYNGSIHVRNIIYYCIFCVIRYSIYRSLHYLDVIPLVFAIKDVYCVMLQRYNYIQIQLKLPRLDALRKTRIERKIKKTVSVLNNIDYDESHRQADLKLIQRLRTSVEHGESIVLNEEDREAYARLSNIIRKSKEQQ